ncbi:MCM2/3/5 family protein, partial [Cardiosporidium cionae]
MQLAPIPLSFPLQPPYANGARQCDTSNPSLPLSSAFNSEVGDASLSFIDTVLSVDPSAYESAFLAFFMHTHVPIRSLVDVCNEKLAAEIVASGKPAISSVPSTSSAALSTPRSFYIDVLQLLAENPYLGVYLLKAAPLLLDLLNQWIVPNIYSRIFQTLSTARNPTGQQSLHNNGADIRWKTRLTHLPEDATLTKTSVRSIRSEDVGKLIAFSGTITRAGEMKMLEEQRTYRCRECSYQFKVSAAPELFYSIDMPLKCPAGNYDAPKIRKFNPKTKKTITSRCTSISFEEIETEILRTDYQEIRVQELQRNLEAGKVPRTISVVLRDGLVNTVQPGEEIHIIGIVWRRWRKLKRDIRCDIELFIEANNLESITDISPLEHSPILPYDTLQEERKEGEDEFKARKFLIDAVCPNLSGLSAAKLAVLLTLIGGCKSPAMPPGQGGPLSRWKYYEDKKINLLMEPSTEMVVSPLKNVTADGDAHFASPPEIMRDGRELPDLRFHSHLLLVGDPGTGKSQLLKAASELSPRSVCTTGSEWMLEAGALVLADGGVCCIDEFSCMRKDNRASIHEAMEQQTVSVAKHGFGLAGLISKLNCRCSVVAATNSREISAEGVVDTAIPLPLLSRFDLIVIFSDNIKKDEEKVSFILERELAQETSSPKTISSASSASLLTKRIHWTSTQLKHQPAEQLISRYYSELRRSTAGGATTIRSFESLIRLCQAHARLLRHTTITLRD